MTLPCIVCNVELKHVFNEEEGNQPYNGTTFVSHGQYGSTVFDPLDGSFLEVNICDLCLRATRENVLFYRRKQRPHEDHHPPTIWDGN